MVPHVGLSGPETGHGVPSNEASGSGSRRRNTDPLNQNNNGWSNPPVLLPFNPAQFPVYSPQWQLAYANQFMAPQLLQFAPAAMMPPPPHPSMQPTNHSRSRSPHKNSRMESRSPERRQERTNGDSGKHAGRHHRSSVGGRGHQTWSARSQKATSPPVSLPMRPAFPHTLSNISQQSASMPSTPQQYPQQMPHSRSPSPNRLAQASPRSSYSEASSPHPTSRPFRGCRFEIGMAASRRRMAYNIGSEKLGPATGPVPASLPEDLDKQLTARMDQLYQKLLPTAESEERRDKFVSKLQALLNAKWPEKDMRVQVFGSTGNSLSTKDSDVDVCITTPTNELDRICKLADMLDRNGMSRVICVSNAKVPIVKIWDPELNVACDMNVNNTLALENTRMIKTYIEIDERVRPLAMIVKYWTRKRILNDAALGGTLSSYTWICLIINFLQLRDPPVLPSLHKRKHKKRPLVNGVDVSFDDDLSKLRGYGKRNKESIGSLLFHFFRRYGYEVDFETSVMSVREGRIIPKTEKGWHLRQNNQLGVEEPFNIDRNLGNTADDTSVRGLHLEFRRAFELLAESTDLEKCCEEYTFPAIESSLEKSIFEKPTPQPLPVLSRSSSRSRNPRNGFNGSIRAHKNQHGGWGSGQSRRASSGMAHSTPNTPFFPSELSNGFVPHNGILPEQVAPLPNLAGLESMAAQLRIKEAQMQLEEQIRILQQQWLQLKHQELLQQQRHQQEQSAAQSPTEHGSDDEDKRSVKTEPHMSNGTIPLQNMNGASPMMLPLLQNGMYMNNQGLLPMLPLDANGMLMMPQQPAYYPGMQFGMPFASPTEQMANMPVNGHSVARPEMQRSSTGRSSATLRSEVPFESRQGSQVNGNALGLSGLEANALNIADTNGQPRFNHNIFVPNGSDSHAESSDAGEYTGFYGLGEKSGQFNHDSAHLGMPFSPEPAVGSGPLMSPFNGQSDSFSMENSLSSLPDKPGVIDTSHVSSTHYDDSPVLMDSSSLDPELVSPRGDTRSAPAAIVASPGGSDRADNKRRSIVHQLLGKTGGESAKSDRSGPQLSHSFVDITKSGLSTPQTDDQDTENKPPVANKAIRTPKAQRSSKGNVSIGQMPLQEKPGPAPVIAPSPSPKSFPANGITYAKKLEVGVEPKAPSVVTAESSKSTSPAQMNNRTNGHAGHTKSASSRDDGWQTTGKKNKKKRASLNLAAQFDSSAPDTERKGG